MRLQAGFWNEKTRKYGVLWKILIAFFENRIWARFEWLKTGAFEKIVDFMTVTQAQVRVVVMRWVNSFKNRWKTELTKIWNSTCIYPGRDRSKRMSKKSISRLQRASAKPSKKSDQRKGYSEPLTVISLPLDYFQLLVASTKFISLVKISCIDLIL